MKEQCILIYLFVWNNFIEISASNKLYFGNKYIFRMIRNLLLVPLVTAIITKIRLVLPW